MESPAEKIAGLEKRLAAMEAEQERLIALNSQLRRFYELAPLGYQSLDENGCFLSVNQAWIDALGYTREDVLGRNFAEFLHPDWQEHFRENFPRFKAVGEILGVEFEMVRKDGTLLTVSFHGKIGRDSHGAFQQTHCIFQDITAVRQMEKEYRLFFDIVPELVCIAGNDGYFSRLNEYWQAVLGYSEEELLATPIGDFIHPDERQDILAAIAGVTKPGAANTTFHLTNRFRHRDESYRWFEWHAVPAPGGKLFAVVRDQTERKLTEEALNRNRSELQAIYDYAPVMLCVLDRQRRVLFANPAFTSFTGVGEDDLRQGRACGIFGCVNARSSPLGCGFAPECVDCFLLNALEETFASGVGQRQIEAHLCLDRNGSQQEVVLLAATALIRGEEHDNLLLCLVDITARKLVEAEHDKLKEQLIQVQKMESVGRLAGGVAHDFNNMLGVILGYTELVLAQVAPGEQIHAALEGIHQAAQRSAELTRQLLAFARKQTVTPRVLDLDETVSGMLSMLRRLIGEEIDLLWLPRAGRWSVKVDPAQVDQILVNLCVNARDAISGPGKITIESAELVADASYCAGRADWLPGEYVVLSVSDNGCGMSREVTDRIFEPFYTTKVMGKGTGLGLATVYGIVKQNKGQIKVYSEAGQGTTFELYFPRHAVHVHGDADQDASGSAANGFETILVVEDEPMVLEMTTLMLQNQGYQVLAAATPGEALQLAETYAGVIDLLLTDVVMPEMNGRDLAKNLLDSNPGIKRLFMSGYTASVIAHHGVLAEGVQFIQKPFTMRDLIAAVKAALAA